MSKEFKKKYMHPTRRKLVDMVLNGSEYDVDSFVSYTDAGKTIKRQIGEVWTDANGVQWEQRSFGKMQVSQLTETMSEVRNWLRKQNECKNETCSKSKYGYTDKKLIKKTGYCSNCLAEKEFSIKVDGLWEVYEAYRISQNMLSHGIDVLKQLNQAYSEVKDEYEFVNEDGSIEKWKMEKSVDELKDEINQSIDSIKIEMKDVLKIRDENWEKLKDKNYDLVNLPIEVDI